MANNDIEMKVTIPSFDRYCVNCEWCREHKESGLTYACFRPDLVTAATEYRGSCKEQRRSEEPDDCGLDGRYFNEKESDRMASAIEVARRLAGTANSLPATRYPLLGRGATDE